MNKLYQWPDGSLHPYPFKRTIPAPKSAATLWFKLRFWLHSFKKIHVDLHLEGNKIIKVVPHVVIKKIGNGKLPKQK